MNMLLNNSVVRKGIIINGLVLYLDGKSFTNSPPSTVWNDKSGQNNNATANSFNYTTSSGSDNNGGVVFDGIDDLFTIPSTGSSLSLLGNNFTLDFVCKFNALPTTNQMLSSRRTAMSVNSEYIFYYNGSTYSFIFTYTTDGSTSVSCSFPVTISTGIWYDIVLKREKGNLYLVINGITNSTTNSISGSLYQSAANLALGASLNTVYGNMLNGVVKRVLQYNRSLSGPEIIQNYKTAK